MRRMEESLRKTGRYWRVNEVNVSASNDTRQPRIRQAKQPSCIQDTNNRWDFFYSMNSSPKSTVADGLRIHCYQNRRTFLSKVARRSAVASKNALVCNHYVVSTRHHDQVCCPPEFVQRTSIGADPVSDIFRPMRCSLRLCMWFFCCLGWTNNVRFSNCNSSITILISV